jgi:autotransporter-associated beta strand protein
VTVNIGSNQFIVGSGTLIAPDWILTAARNVTLNTSGTPQIASASAVDFGQGTAYQTPGTSAVSQIAIESGWDNNLALGNDLALLQLSTPITSIAPPSLYTSSLGTEIGQTATIIGYGYTGTGMTGETAGTIGTRRGIQNTIDAFGGSTTTGGPPADQLYSFSGISSNLMLTDFDEPGVPSASLMGIDTPLPLEGASVAGDSGGGLFITVNNQTYLAGVTDFVGVFSTTNPFPNADGHYGDYNGYTRLSVSQSMSFIDSTLQTSSAWNLPGSGTWASLGSWSSAGIPEFAGASANFTGSATAATTVSLNANWTVGNMTFNNSHGYTIAPGTSGSFFLDNGGATATGTITDSAGPQTISAPLVLNSNVAFTVTNSTDTLTVSGAVSGTGGISMSGAGTLSLSSSNSYAGATTINSGVLSVSAVNAIPSSSAITNSGTLRVLAGSSATPFVIASVSGSGTLSVGALPSSPGYAQLRAGGGTSSVASLSVASNSTLDITNNILVINFPSGNDPAAAIRGYLTTGYNADKWTGVGINSSYAAANPGLYAVGYADGSRDAGTSAGTTQIVIENTLAGDANLDGTVNFADLLVVAQNFNHTLDTHGNAIDWADGDFNYDGQVNFADLLLIAQNFNKKLAAGQLDQLPGSFAADWQLAEAEVAASQTNNVPEPAGMGLLALMAATLTARLRRERVVKMTR